MNRREEIELAFFKKRVQSNHKYDEKSFKEAVEWADKTRIEKAHKWILHNMHKYVKWHPTESLTVCVNNEDMANDFKQAMEE